MANKQGRGTRATPTAQNRGTQARPGDATGMEQERLRRENASAIREAATRTTLVTPPVVESVDEVVDYSGGGSPNAGAEESARVITMEEALNDGATALTTYDDRAGEVDVEALADGKTDVRAEVLDVPAEEPAPAHGGRRDSKQQSGVRQTPVPVVEEAYRVLRVNTDLEDITIGKDNHFTFRVGTPYKVQASVYDHLAEKGYVLR